MYSTISTKVALELRELLNENPDLPLVFIADDRGDDDYTDPHLMAASSVELGKILDDEDLVNEGIPLLTDEELRLMIRDGIEFSYGREFYQENPDRYMKEFAEEANELKQHWKKAVIVHLGAV